MKPAMSSDGPTGSELDHLERSIPPVVADGTAASLRELCSRTAELARGLSEPERGLSILAELLRLVPMEMSGPVLVQRASLWGYLRRYERRSRDLRSAAEAFAAGDDKEGACRVLADLALPVDAELTLAQRAEVGREALDLAESLGRNDLASLCATNVGLNMMLAGDRSALDLRHYLEANVPSRTDTDESRIALRNWLNWANASVAFGLHDEVDRVQRALVLAPDTPRKRRLRIPQAAVHWRQGRWDEAKRICSSLRDAPLNSEDVAVLRIIEGAIDFQRRPMMKPNGLAVAADSIVDEDPWNAIGRAVVMDIRIDRREPRPARGLAPLVQRIKSMGILVGWEDLLPATGRVSPDAHRQLIGMLGDTRPKGERGEACLLAGEGLATMGSKPEAAAEILAEAAERFDDLGESFPAARCLESAAEARNRTGRYAGELWRRAASTYRELGADRALTGLLRKAHGTSALEGFHVPASYKRAPSAGLTRREQEVADLARRGYTARGIAGVLSVSHHTVLTHFKHIREKLQVGSKQELIRLLSED
jgi:DNA-binding CsgD family transcriptional regulator